MRKIAIVAVLALVCSLGGRSDEPGAEPTRCEMKLADGSLIKGALKGLPKLSLKTRHGTLSFDLKDAKSVAWGNVKKEELDTIVAKDGTFKGWIEDVPPIEVETPYGVLKVPTTDIRSLRIVKAGHELGSDFESDDLADWTRFGGSSWSVIDGKLQCQASGSYDCLLYGESLEGAWSLDADVTMTTGGTCGVLFHAQNGVNASALWLQQGTSYIFSGGTWYNNQIATWPANFAIGSPVHVRLDVDGSKVSVTIAGAHVGDVTVSGNSGRVGFFSLNQGTSFDNLVISR